MKTIKLERVLREGIRNFFRDKWLTLATVVIMSLALYLVGVAVFLGYGVLHMIDSVESRVNISMYFDFTVTEDKIMEIKKAIEDKSIAQVQSVTYVSREQALDDFLKREGESEDIREAIDMIGENPLPASLVIVAQEASAYDAINTYLVQEYGEYIMDTSFDRNKAVIKDIQQLIVFARNSGLVLGVIFAIIAILVTLNTVRMSLYAHRAEFEIMRLVGASNLYVKIPTLVEGIMYGLASAIMAMIFLVVTIYSLDPFAQKIVENIDISALFGSKMVTVITSMILLGTGLGLISSYIGIRRYLER